MAEYYSFNGAKLTMIPTVAEEYKYLAISKASGLFDFVHIVFASTEPFYYDPTTGGMGTESDAAMMQCWQATATEWLGWEECENDGNSNFVPPIWANHDILTTEAIVYLPATEPVLWEDYVFADVLDKLAYTKETKELIKEAIIAKGVDVPDAATFREYAGKIGEIETGGVGYSVSFNSNVISISKKVVISGMPAVTVSATLN